MTDEEAYLESAKKRFWAKVKKSKDSDGCWEWQGCKTRAGYGQINLNGKSCYAHRFVWEFTKGQIPDGIYACHHCDNPGCVNPDHIFLGTNSDNQQDAKTKGRRASGSNKLTEEDVVKIRKRYSIGDITQRKIADIYGVTDPCISMIVTRKTWGEI